MVAMIEILKLVQVVKMFRFRKHAFYITLEHLVL